jgi:predicted nucleic acid-binding protein
MILLDVNVLVYAHREDAVEHLRFRQWLENLLKDAQPYGISDHALSGFLRVVTHPRVFAALAIESDCEWMTTDRDYRKIPGLRWRHPLTGESATT